MGNLPANYKLFEEELFKKVDNPAEYKRAVDDDGLVRELIDQTCSSFEEYEYPDDTKIDQKGFNVVPSATLNPFMPGGKCSELDCTLSFTDKFINTTCLYSGKVYIRDPISPFFLSNEKLSEYDKYELYKTIRIYKKLEPLIKNGVIAITTPRSHCCSECNKEVESRSLVIAQEMTEELINNSILYKICDINGYKTLDLESNVFDNWHDDSLTYRLCIKDNDFDILKKRIHSEKMKPKSKIELDIIAKYFTEGISTEINHIVHNLQTADILDSSIITGSRFEAISISKLDNRHVKALTCDEWEKPRKVELPMIINLSAEEILRLREDAKEAIPNLQIHLSELIARGKYGELDTIIELNKMAADVKSEISSLKLNKEKRFNVLSSTLTVAVVLYGLASTASGVAGVGIAGLLASIGHMRMREISNDAKVAKIESSPGYALLKMEEIKKKKN